MAIERAGSIYMAEGSVPTESQVSTSAPEQGVTQGGSEVKALISPDQKPAGLLSGVKKVLSGKPKVEVLVEPSGQNSQKTETSGGEGVKMQNVFVTEGKYVNQVNPEDTSEVIRKMPRMEGGSGQGDEDQNQPSGFDLFNDEEATNEQAAGGGGRPPEPPAPEIGGMSDDEKRRLTERIWSPEFMVEGAHIARAIFELEGEEYEHKYNNENGPRLAEYYRRWRGWVADLGKRSYLPRPFKEIPDLELIKKEPGRDNSSEEVQQPDDLLDKEGNPLPSVGALWEMYQGLTENPRRNRERIAEIESQLSRYFKEAKRLNLLVGIDDALKPIYVKYRKTLQEKGNTTKLQTEVEEEDLKGVAYLGRRLFRLAGASIEDEAFEEKLDRLNGIWNVYAERAVDRFSGLLNGGGLIKPKTIEGEFDFENITIEDSLQLTSDDALRQMAQNNETVRMLAIGASPDTIRALAEQGLQGTTHTAEDVERYYERLMVDRTEVYRLLSQDRERAFQMLVVRRADRDKAAADNVADMALLNRMRKGRELYWRPQYASYYEVSARTPEEFQTAVDTFTEWLRSGLTKSPNEIFQRVSGFKDALTTAGLSAGVDVIPLKLELEAMVGIIGADHSNELYHADAYKQFLDFIAAEEGPARMIRITRSSGGKVAAALWKFDNDPRFKLLFAAAGSRGQLQADRDAVAQQEIRKQILHILTEELMALEIKSYHPEDPHMRTKKETEELADKYEAKLKELQEKSAPQEQIKQVEEYLAMLKDPREYNLNQISKFRSDEDFKKLFDGFDEPEQHELLKRLEGKPREELKPAEQELLTRLQTAREIMHFIENGGDADSLPPEQKSMFKRAENAAHLAFEMYGIMGEKARRGGAYFLVDRKNEQGQSFVDYMQVYQAEQFVQFAENWTKAIYGGELDPEVSAKLGGVKGIPAAELKYRVDQSRRMAIWALKTYGYEAKLWDFTLLRNGKAVDPNTCGYSKYGVDESKSNPVDKYRYAVPENPTILGYNSKGEPVRLIFDDNGKPIVNWEFDASGKAIIYDRAKKEEIVYEISEHKGEAPVTKTRQRIVFDNLDKNTQALPLFLKTPDHPNGKHVTFKDAVKHIYSRWSGHPYWGYQEEDTSLFLSEETFAAAKRIREGKSRPEDEVPHATQLLIVDPTLQRVSKVLHKETVEDRVSLAAVEESYQGHWRINDELYQTFMPDGPYNESQRVHYGTQDFGGSTKTWFHAKALAARWPDANARRGHKLLNVAPMHFGSMADMWGAGGALNVIRMFGYEQYKMVGLFGFQKWIAQTEGASDLLDSFYGFRSPQEKRSREGVFEKPNNDADKMSALYKLIFGTFYKQGRYNPENWSLEDDDNKFMNLVRDTLGRFETVSHRIRVLETDMRGERGPMWIEGIDVFLRNPDGSIKTVTQTTPDGEKITTKVINPDIYGVRDTGSSRHSGTIWHWRFVNWFRSRKPGEGQAAYPGVAAYYEFMDRNTYESIRAVHEHRPSAKLTSHWEWLLGKFVR